MASESTPAALSTICGKCGHSLTRPDIKLRISPVPTLLGKNYHLSTPQADIVRSTISATLADVSQLDDEILRLQAALKELKHKRQGLQSYVNDHKVLVAPMLRFPSEVLSEIFRQCIVVDWLDGIPEYASTSFDKTPLICASICSQWRNVALITPRLWSSITLTPRPKHIKRHVNLAQLWFSRSRHSPLSISLQTPSDYRNNMRQLMDVFTSKSDCWRNVRLVLPLPMLQFLGSAKNRLPVLEWLSIRLWEDIGSSKPIDTFACAPRLRALGIGSEISPISFKAPWDQLRTVDLGHHLNAQQLLNTMALMPNMETCHVQLAPDPISTTVSHQPHALQLPKLQSLAIHVTSAIGLGPFLAALHLPNIRDLSLRISVASWESTLTAQLVSLLSPSKLQKLTLRQDRASGGDIIKILAATPELQELQLLGPSSIFCMDDDFLAHFGRLADGETPVLVPKLQTFGFRYSPGTKDLNFVALNNAMVSRTLPQGSLRVVTISCYRETQAPKPNDPSTLARWDQFREAGLDFQIVRQSLYNF